MSTAGQRLRALREKCGLTVRDVEAASEAIATGKGNPEFAISISRLSDIETKGILPNIFRIYSLSVIYKTGFNELVSWFGVDEGEWQADLSLVSSPKTQMLGVTYRTESVSIPVSIDDSFDIGITTDIGRAIQRWGDVPLAFVRALAADPYIYAYVGNNDFSMYPLILPGSFLQVDENRTKVENGPWASEYERPIYFIETRERFHIGWCTTTGSNLVVQPHPLSGEQIRTYKQPHEAEILGQVVGVAMRLAWRSEVHLDRRATPRLHS
jgi:transcriptional regulator with XRE-family HTH domain